MTGEISFDLVMADDMKWVEGTFRRPGCDWEVLVFRNDPVPEVVVKNGKWETGVTGLFVRVPLDVALNVDYVRQTLARVYHIDDWKVVQGPDSMTLR